MLVLFLHSSHRSLRLSGPCGNFPVQRYVFTCVLPKVLMCRTHLIAYSIPAVHGTACAIRNRSGCKHHLGLLVRDGNMFPWSESDVDNQTKRLLLCHVSRGDVLGVARLPNPNGSNVVRQMMNINTALVPLSRSKNAG